MILAIDTSLGTSVALLGDDGTILAERSSAGTRGHAEAIGTLLADAFGSLAPQSGSLSDAERAQRAEAESKGAPAISAVVVGMGPGPFTGLRVGIAAARAFAAAREVPVWPVLSHDAVAAAEGGDEPEGAFAVVTDAKRHEHYLTRYSGVEAGVPLRVGGSELVRIDEQPLDIPELRPTAVSAAQLGRVALCRRALGLPTGPDQPQYLREPDVTPPGAPKRVS